MTDLKFYKLNCSNINVRTDEDYWDYIIPTIDFHITFIKPVHYDYSTWSIYENNSHKKLYLLHTNLMDNLIFKYHVLSGNDITVYLEEEQCFKKLSDIVDTNLIPKFQSLKYNKYTLEEILITIKKYMKEEI